MTESKVNFAVTKQKIIKTDELLQMYAVVNNQLDEVKQLYKSSKVKNKNLSNEIDRLSLENERINFNLSGLKCENDKLLLEYNALKEQYSQLEQKYGEQVIENQLRFQELEDNVEQESKKKARLKIDALDVECGKLKKQENESKKRISKLILENKQVANELESFKLKMSKVEANLMLVNSNLKTEIVQLKENHKIVVNPDCKCQLYSDLERSIGCLKLKMNHLEEENKSLKDRLHVNVQTNGTQTDFNENGVYKSLCCVYRMLYEVTQVPQIVSPLEGPTENKTEIETEADNHENISRHADELKTKDAEDNTSRLPDVEAPNGRKRRPIPRRGGKLLRNLHSYNEFRIRNLYLKNLHRSRRGRAKKRGVVLDALVALRESNMSFTISNAGRCRCEGAESPNSGVIKSECRMKGCRDEWYMLMGGGGGELLGFFDVKREVDSPAVLKPEHAQINHLAGLLHRAKSIEKSEQENLNQESASLNRIVELASETVRLRERNCEARRLINATLQQKLHSLFTTDESLEVALNSPPDEPLEVALHSPPDVSLRVTLHSPPDESLEVALQSPPEADEPPKRMPVCEAIPEKSKPIAKVKPIPDKSEPKRKRGRPRKTVEDAVKSSCDSKFKQSGGAPEPAKVNIVQDILIRAPSPAECKRKFTPSTGSGDKVGEILRLMEGPKCRKVCPPQQTVKSAPPQQTVKSAPPPDCPASPEPECCPIDVPRTIPLEKPKPMPLNKADHLFKKLLNYSREEGVLKEVVGEFSNQDPDYVAQMVLEIVSTDIHDKASNAHDPRAPPLTETQMALVGLMTRLDGAGAGCVRDLFLSKAEVKLFSLKADLRQVVPLARTHAALCKARRDVNRARRFCCEAFYFMGDLAVPLLFAVLTSWTQVMPDQSSSQDHPIARVLVQLVHLKDCNQPGYNLQPLRSLLTQFYGYAGEREDDDRLFEEIFNRYISNPVRNNDLALILYCKNRPDAWVLAQLDARFRPVVHKIRAENFRATVLVLFGKLCSNVQEKGLLKETRMWLESLKTESTSTLMAQATDYCLRHIPQPRKPPAGEGGND